MSSDNSVRSIGRAIDLLALFDHRHPFLALRDIVELSGLPKTTVVRLLANLEQRSLISTRADGSYTLGAGFLRWVRMSSSLWDVNESTRQCMRRLAEECGETVNIYVRQDLARVSISQHEGAATVRNVIEVGKPMPLWAGASAKVLLADAPEIIEAVASGPDGVDAATLREQVAEVKEAGYALSHGEREFGATSVSAPIVAGDGRVLAALSVSGPTSRFTTERLEAILPAVTTAAKEISGVGLGSVEALL